MTAAASRGPLCARRSERVDDALAAQQAGVRREAIADAFGEDAARAAALAARLRARRLAAPTPEPRFVAQLEGRVRAVYARAATPAARRYSVTALRRSMAAAGIAACLVAGVVLAPAGGASAVQAAAAPSAAAARTPDGHAGPTPRARSVDVRQLAFVPASVARHPAADATRPPIGLLH